MSRLGKLYSKLKNSQIAALVVSDPLNIYYLSGFKGLLPEERESVLVVDSTSLHLFEI